MFDTTNEDEANVLTLSLINLLPPLLWFTASRNVFWCPSSGQVLKWQHSGTGSLVIWSHNKFFTESLCTEINLTQILLTFPLCYKRSIAGNSSLNIQSFFSDCSYKLSWQRNCQIPFTNIAKGQIYWFTNLPCLFLFFSSINMIGRAKLTMLTLHLELDNNRNSNIYLLSFTAKRCIIWSQLVQQRCAAVCHLYNYWNIHCALSHLAAYRMGKGKSEAEFFSFMHEALIHRDQSGFHDVW